MGAILFSLLCASLGFCLWGAINSECFIKKSTSIILFIVLVGVFFTAPFVFMTNTVNVWNQQFCAEFEAQKQTYERAIENENLTGLERLEITNKIMELNADLASEQVSVVQWYNFNLSQENKERTLALTMIK